jgi:general secretion pathway protein G
MHHKTQKAFTMVELIFVIVIIGILTAIAVPKFQGVSEEAMISKASSQLASVRSALSTERQKRILQGDFSEITSLGNVFTTFSAAADGATRVVLQYPPTACAGASSKGCWTNSGQSYVYNLPDSGDAKFKLENNKLLCDGDAADCKKLGD